MEEWNEANHIIVVDDDVINLKMAGSILSENGMFVTALGSGKALLQHMENSLHSIGNVQPDLILLDILMPGMDGFETLDSLRDFEHRKGLPETPVIFLTGDDDKEVESKGFAAGALDFIRKPFEPEALLHRIRNVLINVRRIQLLSEEASTDKLTGLLNKDSVSRKLEKVCFKGGGTLFVIDLDSFKLVNDIYGHEAGDEVLIAFSKLLNRHFRSHDILGRIGGDEFIAFLKDAYDEEAAVRSIRRLNGQLKDDAIKILGKNMTIPLGVSAGAVISPGGGSFEELFKKADRALLHVKQNGKHDCYVWKDDMQDPVSADKSGNSLKRMNMILDERNVDRHALWLGQEAFSNIYRYMLRYIGRYQERAYKVLFTILPSEDETMSDDEYGKVVGEMGELLRGTLRNSDIMMQSSINQYFLLLPMVASADIQKVIDRILGKWEQVENHGKVSIYYEMEAVTSDREGADDEQKESAPWIMVVDDDITNLKAAGNILSDNGMRVTALNSGQALLDSLAEGNRPDLVLLDVVMPGIDGFETLKRIKDAERSGEEIPVVFLTAVDDAEAEAKGLALGAIDFIRKPFRPEVLIARVKLNNNLARLQRNLSLEVERKTSENEQMFMQVVQSLAAAIDAKDTYTNGHSGRVAQYAKLIAKRYGYSYRDQNDIYMIGLLHDVGKIGIPDEVINKPTRLTDQEYAIIKTHPVLGANILGNIKKLPKLAAGARWHHERYGGGGYPDGISGDDIPEEARIIAVADAYDAMTSNRSYRQVMSQDEVREQIEQGSGTQFDPKFAKIMLQLISEDINYTMREI